MKRVSVQLEIRSADVGACINKLAHLERLPLLTILGFQLEGDDDWGADEDAPHEPFRFGAGLYQKLMVDGEPVSRAVELEAEARAREAYYAHIIASVDHERSEDINPAPREG
jgi:hypothetical protein